jgi:hypothetical protein
VRLVKAFNSRLAPVVWLMGVLSFLGWLIVNLDTAGWILVIVTVGLMTFELTRPPARGAASRRRREDQRLHDEATR